MDSALRKQLKEIVWCNKVWKTPECPPEAQELVSQCATLPVPEAAVDLMQVIANSKDFPIPFPIDTVRLVKLKSKCSVEKLNRNIKSTYPITHERVVILIANFLLFKRKYGSDIEKDLYKDMTIVDFIDRILKKRAVTFMKAQDQYKLLNGKTGVGGWESVGTDAEQAPLVLAECLSYDEMKLSALLYVSGYTECINEGARKNAGVLRNDDIENEAVIIGVVGPRFKRKNRMEYEDMLVTEDQNVAENGYAENCPDPAKRAWRQLWDDFYQIPSTLHRKLSSEIKLVPCSGRRIYSERWARVRVRGDAFDNAVYHRRLCLTADVALLEADARARAEGKSAFLNVIGAGLGIWKVSGHQLDAYILSFLQRVAALLDAGRLHSVSDVNFAYIKAGKEVAAFFKLDKSGDGPECRKLFIKNESHPRGGINVQLESREPSAKLSGAHAGKLLVLTYAWDSNAHPGNEFWMGKLSTSGDSAAACATQITELHNAHINPVVSGPFARVAATDSGVTPLPQYCANVIST